MITLSGDLGKFFVSYKLVATASQWQVTRDDKVLGAQVAAVSAKISWADELLVGHQVSKVSFRLNGAMWSWFEFKKLNMFMPANQEISFEVVGDPVITLI